MTITPAQIHEEVRNFIKEGTVWRIDRTRPKTFSACVEVLCRVPREVRDFITSTRRLFVLAPGVGCPALSAPYAVEADSTNSHLRIIFLAEMLERAAYPDVVLCLVKCLSNALHDACLRRDITADDDIIEWGFSRELRLSKSYREERARADRVLSEIARNARRKRIKELE